MKLWIGQTISQFGSQITSFAIPIIAILALNVTPTEMGLLSAAGWLPKLLISLFAGVWIDRSRRKAILIATDLGRGILLLLIPLFLIFGILRIEILYFITFLIGFLGVFFDIAYTSYLPTLISTDQLVDGNSKLTATQSAARIAGPGLGGVIVQLLSIPLAIILDVLSFGISALFLFFIRKPEAQPGAAEKKGNIWKDIRDGMKEVIHQPILRALACSNGIANLFWGIVLAMFILYLTRELKIEIKWLGFIIASQNVGLFLGTFVAKKMAGRLGVGPTIISMPIFSTIAVSLIAFAIGSPLFITIQLIFAQFLIGFALIIYHINQMSLQQCLITDDKRGRVNATMNFIGWCISPFGAFLGGLLGEHLGLRSAMIVAAAGLWLAVPWLLFSPLRKLRTFPKQIEQTSVAAEIAV